MIFFANTYIGATRSPLASASVALLAQHDFGSELADQIFSEFLVSAVRLLKLIAALRKRRCDQNWPHPIVKFRWIFLSGSATFWVRSSETR
jgi:hypothetical protein